MKKRSIIKAGVLSAILGLTFSISSSRFGSLNADSPMGTFEKAKSIGSFNIIAILFFGASVIFFLYVLLKKD
jgi:hypothetical protein